MMEAMRLISNRRTSEKKYFQWNDEENCSFLLMIKSIQRDFSENGENSRHHFGPKGFFLLESTIALVLQLNMMDVQRAFSIPFGLDTKKAVFSSYLLPCRIYWANAIEFIMPIN